MDPSRGARASLTSSADWGLLEHPTTPSPTEDYSASRSQQSDGAEVDAASSQKVLKSDLDNPKNWYPDTIEGFANNGSNRVHGATVVY
jgi:hypothetical protein